MQSKTLQEYKFSPAYLDLIEKMGNRVIRCEESHWPDSCNSVRLYKLYSTFKIAFKVFTVVHVIPSIIFRFRALQKNTKE